MALERREQTRLQVVPPGQEDIPVEEITPTDTIPRFSHPAEFYPNPQQFYLDFADNPTMVLLASQQRRMSRAARRQQRNTEIGASIQENPIPTEESNSPATLEKSAGALLAENPIKKFIAPMTDPLGKPYTPFERELLEYLENNKARLFNIAYRFLSQFPDAEDVAQDCVIKAWKNREKFQAGEDDALAKWTYTIITNTALSVLRRRKNIAMIQIGKMENSERMCTPDASSFGETATYGTSIESVFRDLPQNYREVAVLFYMREYSYKEIIEETGLTIGAVRQRLFRVRKILQSHPTLKELYTEFEPNHSVSTLQEAAD